MQEQSMTMFSMQSNRRKRHQNHRALFDTCLRYETGTPDLRNRSPSPVRPESQNSSRRRPNHHASVASSGASTMLPPNSSRRIGRSLDDRIEDIVAIPICPVEDWFRKDRKDKEAKEARDIKDKAELLRIVRKKKEDGWVAKMPLDAAK